MPHEWLIDVLTDLKAFAHAKGMGASADALDDASLIVLAELDSLARAKAAAAAGEHEGTAGSVTYLFAGSGHA
ncbi:hypothetical protein [Maritimibacter sp. UBA3975]|uniref:hypothetical protein n=1 Tax=Maritimibacter sp. UBA3975 TaxID=1946833 RepID=UPI0025BD55C1|nr:hypothetical protein [Maritimibacter sp. UBA3975]|tara:strand:+ start:18428 stop:18646 length:219 start_codon:yes stop_codon:yes gene_type:complete